MGLVAPRHVGYYWTRARTRAPCIGRRILIHCATREVPMRRYWLRQKRKVKEATLPWSELDSHLGQICKDSFLGLSPKRSSLYPASKLGGGHKPAHQSPVAAGTCNYDRGKVSHGTLYPAALYPVSSPLFWWCWQWRWPWEWDPCWLSPGLCCNHCCFLGSPWEAKNLVAEEKAYESPSAGLRWNLSNIWGSSQLLKEHFFIFENGRRGV